MKRDKRDVSLCVCVLSFIHRNKKIATLFSLPYSLPFHSSWPATVGVINSPEAFAIEMQRNCQWWVSTDAVLHCFSVASGQNATSELCLTIRLLNLIMCMCLYFHKHCLLLHQNLTGKLSSPCSFVRVDVIHQYSVLFASNCSMSPGSFLCVTSACSLLPPVTSPDSSLLLPSHPQTETHTQACTHHHTHTPSS